MTHIVRTLYKPDLPEGKTGATVSEQNLKGMVEMVSSNFYELQKSAKNQLGLNWAKLSHSWDLTLE